MKVLNLESENKFDGEAKRLADLIFSTGFAPDMVVGIPTGGRFVVEAMYGENKKDHIYIKKQRKSTKTKGGEIVSNIVKSLPRPMQNLMRFLEHGVNRFLFFLFPQFGKAVELIALPESVVERINKSKKILVVDDAIDSGCTMLSVLSSISRHNPCCELKVACINTTFSKPLVDPDFCLYYKVLVRYPWAMDARNNVL